MPQGLQVFGTGGQVLVDITDRLTRIVGQVGTGLSAGSISIPEFNGSYGTPWVFVQQRNPSANQFGKRTVQARVNGQTLSWTFEPASQTNWEALPATIIYGVF